MPIRTRLVDFRTSRGPQAIGTCQSDLAGCAAAVNAAVPRLLLAREAGDAGWWGTWARMVFNVDASGYITTPREVARLERMAVCNRAVFIQNEFYEFLDYGIGLQPKAVCNYLQTYERGVFPAFSDLKPGMKLRIYVTDALDVGKRTLIQGTDSTDTTIYSQDGLVRVTGEMVSFDTPFVDTPMTLNSLTGIQKDITNGPVKYYELNPATGDIRLLLTMEPGEKVAAYRRYLVNGIPNKCCSPCQSPTQVTALVKLEFIPVAVDTDYLIIPNLEAVIEECQSVRYSTMDLPTAAQLAAKHHTDAIRLLQGELVHYLGKDRPAIEFKPFGSARLERAMIGTLT